MNAPASGPPQRRGQRAPAPVAGRPGVSAGVAAHSGVAAATAPAHNALWRQLDATAQALQAVRAGQSGTAALAAVSADLRAGVQALLFQTLRNLGRAQALRSALAPRTPAPRADALLCTALALAWDERNAPYTAFTLVNQTIEAAKQHPASRAQAAFINACLRRFVRERQALVAQTDADPQARWNHPRWWIERLQRDHPAHWQHIVQANNHHAPMALRVNQQKSTPAHYQKALAAIKIEADLAGESALILRQPQPVQALPGFAQGVVSVQDTAAQLAAPLLLGGLDLARPLRVLDACAAPGGKTAHLLEWAGSAPLHVTALDIDPARCARITDTLQRVGLQAQVLVADAAQPGAWWPQHCDSQPFDAILLDAPCTASGIVRRHPDVRWLRRESDIAQLAAIQARLLDALWPLLAPGGRMLYCTCSVFRAEGQAQVQAFLARNSQAQLLPSPGHLIPGAPPEPAHVPDNGARDPDGFFYALLQKTAA